MKKIAKMAGAVTLGLVGAGGATAIVACDAQAPSDYEGTPLASAHGQITNASGSDMPSVEMALISMGRTGEHGTQLPFGEIASFDQIVRVPVVGSFPAKFKLDLYTPPPDRVQEPIDFDQPDASDAKYRWSVQTLAVIKGGSPERPVKVADCLLSAASKEYVVYFDRDVPPDAPAPYTGTHCSDTPPSGGSPDGGRGGGTPDAGHGGEGPDAGHGPACYPVPDVTARDFFGGSLSKGYHLVRLRGLASPAGGLDPAPTGFDEVAGGFGTDLHFTIDRTPGADCREPRVYSYDGGVP